MCPGSLSSLGTRPQRPRWQRRRRCLLKGCGQWFRPSHPQGRYCCVACRDAARRWQRWRAQQKYRASHNGKGHRQQQARRYRQRGPSPPLPAPSPPPSPPPPTASAAAPASGSSAVVGEGKRLLEKSGKVPLCPCDRPGCYVLFAAGTPYQPRRFCCALCRKALRCVLQREARWRRRRRRGLGRPGRRPRRRARAP
jgi:hypothetical protein